MPIVPTEGAPRRVLNVFYLLDVSGSMTGAKITMLNSAMEETTAELKKQAKNNADAEVKVAVLTFSSGCRWLNPAGPESLEEDFIWEELQAGGLTDMGAALKELNDKLSRKQYLNALTGNYLPVIIVMTDGGATDDYSKALAEIRQNKWFQRATKIGFAIGEDADVRMICDVVGNSEAVVKTSDLQLFAKLIKFASVTASMLASKSRTTDTGVSGADIVNAAVANGDASKDVVPKDVPYTPETPPEPPVKKKGGGDDWDDDDKWD